MTPKLKNLHLTGDSSKNPGAIHAESWWVSKFLDPRFKFEVLLLGIPGHIRIPPQWQVRQGPQEEHLFYFVDQGGFRGEIAGEVFDFVAGDFIWIPAGTPFHLWLLPGQSLVIHRFRLKTGPGPRGKQKPFPPRILPKAWPCLNWMEQIIAETHTGNPDPPATKSTLERAFSENGGEARLRGLLLCLFTELERVEKAGRERDPGLSRGQKQALMLFAAGNTGRWLRPGDLAEHLHLSHDYFSRLFAESFGRSPRRWLVERRIHQAGLRLAESTLNISQVADEFGYRDVFLFSRQFKMITGCSPSQFRRRANRGG